MKPINFFEFSIACENHKYILDGDTWKEICNRTGKPCESADTCPELDDGK